MTLYVKGVNYHRHPRARWSGCDSQGWVMVKLHYTEQGGLSHLNEPQLQGTRCKHTQLCGAQDSPFEGGKNGTFFDF
jgi:hypothetical protein